MWGNICATAGRFKPCWQKRKIEVSLLTDLEIKLGTGLEVYGDRHRARYLGH